MYNAPNVSNGSISLSKPKGLFFSDDW
jgi:hypothetical protein